MINNNFQEMNLSDDLTPEELLQKIIAKYINYSSESEAVIKFNYCILPALVPQGLKRFTQLIVSPFCS